MKHTFIYLGLLFCILLLTSCKKDISALNTDQKTPLVADAGLFFSNAERTLNNTLVDPNININIFRLFAQYWAQSTYINESRYDLRTRSIPDNFWDRIYTLTLKDLQEAKRLVGSGTDAVSKNKIALIDMLTIYTYAVLVDTYGNIPYTEALNIDNTSPKYDNATAIYDDLLVKLDVALSNLDVTKASFGTADLLYKGVVANWKKFGNSLKLRMGMRLADINPNKAKTIVEQAVQSGVFQTNADGAMYKYTTTTPNTNPIYVDLVQSGREDILIASPLINLMNTLNDPRMGSYFATNDDDLYVGGVYGSQNDYAAFSHVGNRLLARDFEAFLLEKFEVEFLLAEAVERGMNVGGTAASHYKNAITASMLYWNVPQTDIDNYLAQPNVAYATATGTYKQKIGTQKWIALYNRGHEAWCEWKRLGFPILVKPTNALSEIPLRLLYPVTEQNVNTINYNQAAAAIGGDVVTTKVFWDMN